MTEKQKSKYMTSGQTAARLNVTRDTINRWETEGKLKASRTLGNQRRFLRSYIERVASEQEQNADG